MAKNICGIYKIINTYNGKMYIGQSINIIERFYEHKRKLRLNQHYNKHLQNAYNKYGEYFKYLILEECSAEVLDERERYWIRYYNSDNQQYGYNIMPGGQANRPYAEQSKALISKPVLCVETGIIYPSVATAQKETGISNISLACNNKIRHAGGLHWCFLKDATKEHIEKILDRPRKSPTKKVVCIETGIIFNSLSDAAKVYGITVSAVSASCNHYHKERKKKNRPHFEFFEEVVV